MEMSAAEDEYVALLRQMFEALLESALLSGRLRELRLAMREHAESEIKIVRGLRADAKAREN